MKILFDNSWNGKTGIGRVSNEILKRLTKDYDVISVDFLIKKNNPFYPFILSRKIKKYDFDIFISPGFFPITCKVRSIIFIYDLAHVINYSYMHRLYMRLIRPLYKNISFIFTDSLTIKNDVEDWMKGINSNIINFYLDSSLNYSEDKKFSFKKKYLIYPSNYRKHKNHINLINAFNLLNPINNSYYLILTGNGNSVLNRIIKKYNLTNNILFIGDVDDNLLSNYYLNSSGLVFPSTYEGFGIPLVEAMNFKIPIACSDIPVFLEITDGAAIFFDPYDFNSMAKKMKILYEGKYPKNILDKSISRKSFFNYDKSYVALKKAIDSLTNE